MVFVTVAHEIEGENGAFIEEEQDIVYLHIPREFTPPRRVPVIEDPDFDETVSAATYNAHRIHYDLPYAREVEKYPALVVHGPMQATMLMEAASAMRARRPRGSASAGAPDVPRPRPAPVGQARAGGPAMSSGPRRPPDRGYLGMQAEVEWDMMGFSRACAWSRARPSWRRRWPA
jgi:3-methylfumaryl-CoA hydratase